MHIDLNHTKVNIVTQFNIARDISMKLSYLLNRVYEYRSDNRRYREVIQQRLSLFRILLQRPAVTKRIRGQLVCCQYYLERFDMLCNSIESAMSIAETLDIRSETFEQDVNRIIELLSIQTEMDDKDEKQAHNTLANTELTYAREFTSGTISAIKNTLKDAIGINKLLTHDVVKDICIYAVIAESDLKPYLRITCHNDTKTDIKTDHCISTLCTDAKSGGKYSFRTIEDIEIKKQNKDITYTFPVADYDISATDESDGTDILNIIFPNIKETTLIASISVYNHIYQ